MFNFRLENGCAIVSSNCDEVKINFLKNSNKIQKQISSLIYVSSCEIIITKKNSFKRKKFGDDAKYFFHPCGCKITVKKNKKEYTVDVDSEAIIKFEKIPQELAKTLALAIVNKTGGQRCLKNMLV